MSDLIRRLIQSRLPADAIAGQGDYLYGQSINGLSEKQEGEVLMEENPLVKLQRQANGLRSDVNVSGIQLDR